MEGYSFRGAFPLRLISDFQTFCGPGPRFQSVRSSSRDQFVSKKIPESEERIPSSALHDVVCSPVSYFFHISLSRRAEDKLEDGKTQRNRKKYLRVCMSSSFSTISALCPVEYLQAATDEMTYLTHFFRHFNIRNGISSIFVTAFESDLHGNTRNIRRVRTFLLNEFLPTL